MGYFVEYEETFNIVSGRIVGDLTREVAKDYLKSISDLASEKGCNRILTDVREAKLLGEKQDIETLSTELANYGFSTSFVRAIVLAEDVIGYKTWENYCFTAGHKNLRLFVDGNLAKEWLSEQE